MMGNLVGGRWKKGFFRLSGQPGADLTQIPAQLQGPGRIEAKLKELAWFAHKFANFHQDRSIRVLASVGEKMEMYYYKTPSKQ